MPITIGANIASVGVQRQLAKSSDALGRVYERLSSGQRINRASDDAAGLAIASSLTADTRVFTQGIRNLNDGASMLNVAEGALNALSTIAIRQKELAEQAANGVYSAAQRKPMDAEARALTDEFNRIVATTTFNGMRILDPNQPAIRIQDGYGTNGSIVVDVADAFARTVGDGTFQVALTLTGTNIAVRPVAGDVNGDGHIDLIFGGIIQTYLGNGDGTFRAPVLSGSGSFYNKQLYDVNSDGKLDIIYSDNGQNRAGVHIGNGDGTFKAAMSFVADVGGAGVRGLAIGDLNGDGNIDFITGAGLTGTIAVWNGNGDGSFSVGAKYTVGIGSHYNIDLKDMDGDGNLDFIATTSGGGAEIYYGAGDSTFGRSVAVPFSGGGISQSVSAGDMNGDGIGDIVLSSSTGGLQTVLGNADGSFRASTTVLPGSFPNSTPILTDLTGDGVLDIVHGDYSTGGYQTFIGNGDGSFRTADAQTPGGNLRGPGIGDFNEDGAPDLFFRSEATNDAIILLADVTQTTNQAYVSLRTQDDARNSLDEISGTLQRIATGLGSIGSAQSRIQTALNVMGALRENSYVAASRILDADIAAESSALTRIKILQEAGASVLAQANQLPALALQLLR